MLKKGVLFIKSGPINRFDENVVQLKINKKSYFIIFLVNYVVCSTYAVVCVPNNNMVISYVSDTLFFLCATIKYKYKKKKNKV